MRDSANEWRELEDVIDDIGNKWGELTSVEKSAVATQVAGTRQANIFISTMNDYEKVLRASSVSQNAAGTAAEKYTDIMDSLESKINQLEATWDKFINNIGAEDTFKFGVESLTEFISSLDYLLNDIGLLNGAITTFGLLIGRLGVNKLSSGIQKVRKNFNDLSNTLDKDNLTLDKYIKNMSSLNTASQKLILTNSNLSKGSQDLLFNFKKMSAQQIASKASAEGWSREATEQLMILNGVEKELREATLAMYAYTGSVDKNSKMLNKNISKTQLFGASLGIDKFTVISAGIGVATTAINYFFQEWQRGIQDTIDSTNELVGSLDELDQLNSKVVELKKEQNDANTSEERQKEIKNELLNIQDQINEKYKEESGYIDNTNKSLEEQIRLLKEKAMYEWRKESGGSIGDITRQFENAGGSYRYTGTVSKTLKSFFDFVNSSVHNAFGYNPNFGTSGADSYSFSNSKVSISDDVIDRIENIVKDAGGEFRKEFLDEGTAVNLTGLDLGSSLQVYEDMYDAINMDLVKRRKSMSDEEIALYEKLLEEISSSIEGTSDKYEELSPTYQQASFLKLYENESGTIDEYYEQASKLQEAYKNMDVQGVVQAKAEMDKLEESLKKAGYSASAVREGLKYITSGIPMETIDNLVSVVDLTEQYKNQINLISGMSTEEIFNLSGSSQQAQAWRELVDAAEELGLSESDLISVLDQLGIVTDSVTQSQETFEQSIQDTNSAISTQMDQLNNIQSAYNTLKTAVDEYNNTGYISLGTLESLLSLGDEYIGMLQMENGQMTLNQQGFVNMSNATLDNIRALVIRNALNTIERLGQEKTATESNTTSIDNNTQSIQENNAERAKSIGLIITEQGLLEGGAGFNEAQKAALDYYNSVLSSINGLTSSSGAYFSTVSSGAASTADRVSQEFQDAYDEIQYMRDRGLISEEEYLNRLYILNEKYNKDNLKLWRKYDLEIYKGRQQLLSDRKQSAKDRAQEAAERKKKAIDKRIEALRDELDALNDRYEAEDKAFELQKAQDRYNAAIATKNTRVYSNEKGWVNLNAQGKHNYIG